MLLVEDAKLLTIWQRVIIILQDDRGTPGWIRQVEIDTGTSADVAWDIAIDRCSWRALPPQLVKRDWWWWW